MPDDLKKLFTETTLLGSPTRRAAYSDRTAWLMAAMSELAYYKFEGKVSFSEIAIELAEMSDAKDVTKRLGNFLDSLGQGDTDSLQNLKDVLDIAGFDYVNSYDEAGTQAFLATRRDNSMRLLAFRGTEMEMSDIKSDLKAKLVPGEGDEQLHDGFFQAFNRVRESVLEDLKKPGSDAPLYITGHSLGGALAILCTRYLGHDSHGACYTFGGPRVGNLAVAESIKTPIYRIVNAADLVPRLPPAWIMSVIVAALKWMPLPGATTVANVLKKYRGYAHYGDMRYLTHAEAGSDETFASVQILSNPSFPLRLVWVVRRWIATGGKAAGSDHAIALYRKKLRAYAIRRNP